MMTAEFDADYAAFVGETQKAEDELQAFLKFADDAQAAVKDIGEQGAAGIKPITDDTKQLTKEQDALSGVLKSVRSELLAFVSIQALGRFVGDTIEAAGALKVLSQQTQINTTDLQIMAGAMSEFGVSSDQLGSGLFKLSKKIAGGDDSVVSALATMGLSLKDVAGLQGKDLFLAIENGLAGLKGSLRDTTAATLFGDKLGAAMAGASEGIQGAINKQEQYNKFMSKEAIDALDQYNTSITTMKTNMTNMLANALGPLAEGFNTLVDTAQKGASKWQIAWAMIKDAMTPGLVGTENLTKLIDEQNERIEANAAATGKQAAGHGAVTAQLSDEARAVQFLATLEQNTATELTATQIKHLERLKELNALTEANAIGIGVTAAQLKKYTGDLEAAKKATADLATAQKDADTLALTLYKDQIDTLKLMQAERAKSYGTAEQIRMLQALDENEQALTKTTYAQITSESERLKLITQRGKDHTAIVNQIMAKEKEITDSIAKQLLAETEAHTKRNAALGLDAMGYAKVTDAAEILRRKIDELHAQAAAGVPTQQREALLVDEYAQAAADAARESEDWWRAKKDVNTEAEKMPGALNPAKTAVDNIGHAAHNTASGFKSLANEFVATFATVGEAARAANAMLEDAYKKAGFIQHPIISGGVGYNPLANGGGAVNFYITQPLGTPAAIASAVGSALASSYASGGGRLPS